MSYHHGDLGPALLRAADELLAERGTEGFSLRECARRAGVSHSAPAHHFGDARGLLSALAAQGYRELSQALDEAARAASDPKARLVALGEAYVAFALAHPARYQLMFRGTQVDLAQAAVAGEARGTWQRLAWAVASAAGRSKPHLSPADPLAALAWSTVHGFAMLAIDARLGEASARPQAWRPLLRAALTAQSAAYAP